MKSLMNTKKLVTLSVLAALTVILQLLSMFIKFGPFVATLALIPLIIGAICYGPGAGCLLGFIMGAVILFTDSQAFWVINPFYTILICLSKTAIAGLVSGLVFKGLRRFNFNLAVVVATIVAPIVNTGLFASLALLCFYDTLTSWAGGTNTLNYLFLTMIGVNFLIEFGLNSFLSPAFIYLLRNLNNRYDLGLELNKESI